MKILLVEDSKSIAMLMAEQLSSYGHEVTFARNGREAVEQFQAIAPDLVLMDIEMPEMNGFEATLRIRGVEATQKWAWTPIIFLTASNSPDCLVTAIEAGADDFISKPVSESVLEAKMKAMARIAELRCNLSIANRQLEEMALRDRLTGLYNRRHLDLQLNAMWERATRNGTQVAVIMIDVDRFKDFNDRYGHQAGDDCLAGVANVIDLEVEKLTRDKPACPAFCARYGGEEFAVVIAGATSDTVETFSASLLSAIGAMGMVHDANPPYGHVTASIGTNLATPKVCTISNAFRAADAALYQSKGGGRNRATFS